MRVYLEGVFITSDIMNINAIISFVENVVLSRCSIVLWDREVYIVWLLRSVYGQPL
jgi:hypothetical protein